MSPGLLKPFDAFFSEVQQLFFYKSLVKQKQVVVDSVDSSVQIPIVPVYRTLESFAHNSVYHHSAAASEVTGNMQRFFRQKAPNYTFLRQKALKYSVFLQMPLINNQKRKYIYYLINYVINSSPFSQLYVLFERW